ncbi:hypothetical protein KDM41_13755 [bacterium]|nr:hypothetical protein [bacterium]
MKRIAILVCFALAVAAGADARAAGHGLDQGAERHLDGHGFLPSFYVNDPWTATTFQSIVGGGVALGLETPFLDPDGEVLYTLEGDVFYVSLGFGFQQRLGETWAVGMTYAGVVRTGINAATLVTEGANVDRNANLWVKKRLLRSQASQLSVGIDWEYRKTFLISPYDFVVESIDSGEIVEADLLESVKNWTARLTVDYAHAFSPAFGLRANAAIGLYEDPDARGVSKATHRAGVMLEYDLAPGRSIPVGFTLGYTKGFPEDDPGAGLAGVLVGIWYTGREAFTIGAETGFMQLPAEGDAEKLDALLGLLTIRYYF